MKKYLTIPVITSLLYIFFAVAIILARHWLQTPAYENLALAIKIAFIKCLIVAPVIFIATLIFTIAFNITTLNGKNIVYAVLIAAINVAVNFLGLCLINYFINDYLIQSLKIHNSFYFELTYNLYKLFYILLIIFIITGISYYYSHLNKLKLSPLNNRAICALYSGLIITSALIPILEYAFMPIIYDNYPDQLTVILVRLGIILTLLGGYFFYIYTWINQLFNSHTNTDNYPLKIILSYLLNGLFILITSTILCFIPLFIMPLILIFILLFSVFGILIFFALFYFSTSKLYKYVHCAFYALAHILFVFYILKGMDSRKDFLELFFTTALSYGVFIIFFSFTLLLTYFCNKPSINFIFKNTELRNINEN